MKARAGGQHIAPILGLTLIDPQEAIAHRGVEGLGPEVFAAPELAVPRMGKFMGQKVSADGALVPFGEIGRRNAVLAGPLVFQSYAAHLVTQGEQEVIVIIMVGAEELVGLLHEGAMDPDLLGRRL